MLAVAVQESGGTVVASPGSSGDVIAAGAGTSGTVQEHREHRAMCGNIGN